MAMKKLTDMLIAIVATDGFEEVELTEPREGFERAGAMCHVIAPKPGKIRGWNHTEWGDEAHVHRTIEEANPDDYDALFLPGGVMNPDKLRMSEPAMRFIKRFFIDDKPVAAICHGPQSLIEAGVVSGRTMTSYPSIRTDLRNAGAKWVDKEVVTDGNLTTSRNPDDIPAFTRKAIEEFESYAKSRQKAGAT